MEVDLTGVYKMERFSPAFLQTPFPRFSRERAFRTKRQQTVCSLQSRGLVLAGKAVEVEDSPALGSLVSGPVLNRFLRDEGEEWMLHLSFRPDSGFDESVVPGEISGLIGALRSTDGISWEVQKAALKPNVSDWWCFDTTHCFAGDVQGAVYFMYFHGGDKEKFSRTEEEEGVKGYRTRIGVAVSLDGANWSRIEGGHANGAILDVGSEGSFDEEFVENPQVVKLGEVYRLYYNSRDPRTGVYGVGLATSTTGLEFERVSSDPLTFVSEESSAFPEKGISSKHIIVQKDGTFVMFFEGVGASNERSIGMAVSDDGLKWTVDPASPILTKGPAGSWDESGVARPRVVVMDDNSVRLYYSGWSSESNSSGIGLATSDGSDWTNLKRFG